MAEVWPLHPIDVACPHCGQAIGVACRTPSGGKLSRLRKGGFLFHKARIEAVASVDPDDAR